MNSRPGLAESSETLMPAWLDKILGRNASDTPDNRVAVRTALQSAMKARARIVIEAPQGLVAGTTIWQVTRDELVVNQPYMSGMIYPLADGDPMKISFVERSTSITAQTRCLGRVKCNGPKGPMYVYRLRLPDALRFDDRRREPRADIDPAVAPDVQIQGGRVRETIVGMLADISATGMRIHTSGSTENFEIGQELQVQFPMPQPAGPMDEVVEVQRLLRDNQLGVNVICVSFRRRLPRLESLMDMTTERVPMPLEQVQRKIA